MSAEQYTLKSDGGPDVRFTGTLVAEVGSSANNASSYYSGSVGRWTELKLYRTAGGKLVAQSIGYTQWQGEHNRHKVKVCDTEAAVIEWLGQGWLAKLLYDEAGIDNVQDIE